MYMDLTSAFTRIANVQSDSSVTKNLTFTADYLSKIGRHMDFNVNDAEDIRKLNLI